MKLFLDQGVPRRAASVLREAGVSVVHASEIGLSPADDSDILSWCLSNQAIAVTLDADSCEDCMSGRSGPSAVRIRIQGLKGPAVAQRLLDLTRSRGHELESGALVTVQRHGVRLRHLPIASPTP